MFSSFLHSYFKRTHYNVMSIVILLSFIYTYICKMICLDFRALVHNFDPFNAFNVLLVVNALILLQLCIWNVSEMISALQIFSFRQSKEKELCWCFRNGNWKSFSVTHHLSTLNSMKSTSVRQYSFLWESG